MNLSLNINNILDYYNGNSRSLNVVKPNLKIINLWYKIEYIQFVT